MGLSGLHDIRNTNCVSFAVASEWTSVSYFGEKRKKKEKEKKKKKKRKTHEEIPIVRQLHVRTVNLQLSVQTDNKTVSLRWQPFHALQMNGHDRFHWGELYKYHFCATNVFSRQARDKTHPSQAVTSVSVTGGSCHKYHLCVHQPNDANRYDYHLVYTSFPLAFSYISINSHRHWGCSSVHVLWHVINSLIIKISM